MKPALILKLADIAIQFALIIGLYMDGRDNEALLHVCGLTLLWQLVSSILHFFIKAEWKVKSGRKFWIGAFFIAVLLFLGYAPLILFFAPLLILLYLAISFREVKRINSTERIHHIQTH